MIKAVSNALSLPIIVFSSGLHYPVVYTTPRDCQVSIPLYVAFNQAGAGHYSAVSFCNEETTQQESSISARPVTSDERQSRCSCGHTDKNLLQ